ncbi:hypothetical protein MTO96_031863 [Rhipicephalus appendiculatus]
MTKNEATLCGDNSGGMALQDASRKRFRKSVLIFAFAGLSIMAYGLWTTGAPKTSMLIGPVSKTIFNWKAERGLTNGTMTVSKPIAQHWSSTLIAEGLDLTNETANSSQDHIWFLETAYKRKLNARQACSIESTCRHNDDYLVHLLSTGNITSSTCPYHGTLSKYPNFRSSALNATVELAGTPLAPLAAEGGRQRRSPYAMTHLSDFLRYVVLWKRGGAYLDSDIITMKSLKGIRNSAFYQHPGEKVTVANGILFFDKHHPVLVELIDRCARTYDPDAWTACGPKLTSQLPSDAQYSSRINFWNNSAFFVVQWGMWNDLFIPAKAPAVLRAVNGSLGVHFWNALSGKTRVVLGSGSAMDVLARTHCPEVYRIANKTGNF